MDELLEQILKITSALYRVSEVFPENESLRFKIREKGLEILSNFTIIKGNPLPISYKKEAKLINKIEQDFEILKSYFKIAQNQNWVDSRNFLVLEENYQALIKKVQENIIQKNIAQKIKFKEDANINRQISEKVFSQGQEPNSQIQKKILEILKEKGSLASSEFYQYFSEISPRAIRYHLKILKTKNLIEVVGNGPSITYRPKSV